eukprot:CAMPEP_0117439294 /NCGR_PEP_ID=MMETSP0759-20121206/2492_1 /TAXON_ID=63605 /ORGANISM="Percolomonas cosmopolitus, Strain WS" /LENGTH=690 /DNA_ID=CAMNT_0005231007 /DNA_START=2534 /DNA_END=4606 /DNA_ORIENTATION=-
MEKKRGEITITKPDHKDNQKMFTFDAVYDEDSTQLEVYKHTALPIVDSVLDGYNGTVFAYGQTGAGKTWSMDGNQQHKGLIPNAFEHIFHTINQESTDKQFLVRASMLEIYNEEIRDLLGKDVKKPLELKESKDKGVYVKGQSSYVVKSVKEIEKVMAVGKKNRSTGSTDMNAESSRSHCIFTITIETSQKSVVDGEEHVRSGKLHMVDLAGSERADKTGATGDRLKEGCKINLSLSALGNVIKALVDSRNPHVPYRDSKLTRLLQSSLGGNAKTVMLAAISPADDNYDETLSTLRYASRAKKIQNKPKINEDPKDAMIRQFQDEIKRLKAKLEGKIVNEDGDIVDPDAEEREMRRMMEKNEQEKEALKRQMEQKTDAEKQELLKRQQDLEKKAKEMAEHLEKQREQYVKEKNKRDHLQKKLQEMEAHMVRGGKTLLEQHEEHEQEIRAKKEALEEKRRRELELKRELQAKQELRLNVEENYNSIQEEIDLKTRKLKKLWEKYQSTKQEIIDIEAEHQEERDDSLYTVRQLERDLKMQLAIIDAFIPQEEVIKVTQRATWDEEQKDWKIGPPVALLENGAQSKRPQSATGARRPVSEYAKRASRMGDQSTRYKYENIINLELEMPERTTQDFMLDPEEGYDESGSEYDSYDEEEESVRYLSHSGRPTTAIHQGGGHHHSNNGGGRRGGYY